MQLHRLKASPDKSYPGGTSIHSSMVSAPLQRDTSVAIVAEEPIVRYGLRRLLETEPDLTVVGETAESSEAIQMVLRHKPQVLLLELSSAREVLSGLTSVSSSVRTLLLASPADRRQITEAFELGARGVVVKGWETRVLLNGVREVLAGRYWIEERAVEGMAAAIQSFTERHPDSIESARHYGLTRREREIVALIATGCSNKEIGGKFGITERTVKHHLGNVYDKLGFSSRLELALFAVNHHLDVYVPEIPWMSANEKVAEAV